MTIYILADFSSKAIKALHVTEDAAKAAHWKELLIDQGKDAGIAKTGQQHRVGTRTEFGNPVQRRVPGDRIAGFAGHVVGAETDGGRHAIKAAAQHISGVTRHQFGDAGGRIGIQYKNARHRMWPTKSGFAGTAIIPNLGQPGPAATIRNPKIAAPSDIYG